MVLEKLDGWYFKNYEQLSITFASQLNCLVGPNGAGKTNLLDAIHYVCLTRSAFTPVDTYAISHQQPQFGLQALFSKGGQSYTINCSVGRQRAKVFTVNGRPYDKVRAHVGQFPIVFTTPSDTELVMGSSEGRRKFFDALLCQVDKQYLADLVTYQQVLKQRNGLLRMCKSPVDIDRVLMASYDELLVGLAYQLYKKRSAMVGVFVPLLQQHYQYFVMAEEAVDLAYQSDLSQPDFVVRYQQHLQQDWRMQRTGLGIHRDDFVFLLNGYPIKRFGSQGQQKSFILALRLAQFSYMEASLGCKPLLLLDDIFDKLDEQRVARFVQLIAQQSFGQVMLTDAGNERSFTLFKAVQAEKRMFAIEKGSLKDVLW